MEPIWPLTWIQGVEATNGSVQWQFDEARL
jgi:hypothetical protein